MINRNELVNRKVVAPVVRVVVVAQFPYAGRLRKPGEELQLTPTDAQMFGAEGYVRRILGLRRP